MTISTELTVLALATVVQAVLEGEKAGLEEGDIPISDVVIMADNLLSPNDGRRFYAIYSGAIVTATKVADDSPLRAFMLSAFPLALESPQLTFLRLAEILSEALDTDANTPIVVTSSPIRAGENYQTILPIKHVFSVQSQIGPSNLFVLAALGLGKVVSD